MLADLRETTMVAELPGLLALPRYMGTGTTAKLEEPYWDDNLFPETDVMIWTDVTDTGGLEAVTPVFGRSWRFDFAAGEFVITATRKVAVADEKEAWVQWCEKALRTPRYRHLIYSHDYGSELEEWIGSSYGHAVQESEIRRIVTETLLVDARTEAVDQFTFSWEDEACIFSCRIRNVRDETETIESVVI